MKTLLFGALLLPLSAGAQGFVEAVETVQITGLENTDPAWSPDGSNVAQLTDNDAADSTPTFTPDGRHIVWASGLDGNLDMFQMRVDRSDPATVSRDAWTVGATT